MLLFIENEYLIVLSPSETPITAKSFLRHWVHAGRCSLGSFPCRAPRLRTSMSLSYITRRLYSCHNQTWFTALLREMSFVKTNINVTSRTRCTRKYECRLRVLAQITTETAPVGSNVGDGIVSVGCISTQSSDSCKTIIQIKTLHVICSPRLRILPSSSSSSASTHNYTRCVCASAKMLCNFSCDRYLWHQEKAHTRTRCVVLCARAHADRIILYY